MTSNFTEKREFFRISFDKPVQFKTYDENSARSVRSQAGVSRNISQSGILFQTDNIPQISSLLWMNLDIRTLKICQEIEKRALVVNDGLIGRVVRVEENPGNRDLYDVGVCFLTRDQKDSREVQKILAEISSQA